MVRPCPGAEHTSLDAAAGLAHGALACVNVHVSNHFPRPFVSLSIFSFAPTCFTQAPHPLEVARAMAVQKAQADPLLEALLWSYETRCHCRAALNLGREA